MNKAVPEASRTEHGNPRGVTRSARPQPIPTRRAVSTAQNPNRTR